MSVSGSKGDSGESRTPIEAPDSLISTAFARILDLVSEGPIVGLANGLKSIYFDRTPLQNADGTFNFKNVQVETRVGTQDQEYIPGFPAVESETGAGVLITTVSPWSRAFTNLQLTAARVTIRVPQLTKQNKDNGDVTGTTVQFAIDLAVDGGAFVEIYRNAFTGKTTSNYQRSIRIDFPVALVSGWNLRVRRITADSTDSALQSKIYLDSFTEIIDGKFTYPNSAIVSVAIDSSQFGAIPQRGYELLGRIIRIPSNYNPYTRVYTGTWDGTFVLSWTNNPAWVFYDMATHPRYGLGAWIDEANIDKWGLYEIAQHCDELVPDGMGGTEPRFTCNAYIQARQEAYLLMQELAGVFRGMQFYLEGGIYAVSDKPEDPEVLYTNANVIDGKFEYASSPRRTRHSVVSVNWNDPANFYQSVPEFVEDEESVERFGINELQVAAFGCTSQGQAHRAGRYILATEKFEAGVVTFKVGLDGTFVTPGKVVRIADKLRAGLRMGGRIVEYATTHVTVDVAPAVTVGDTLFITDSEGVVVPRVITMIDGNKFYFDDPIPAAPIAGAVWAVEKAELQQQLFRVIGIAEDADGNYEISAVKHEPGKLAWVENEIQIQPRITTGLVPDVQLPPTNLRIGAYGRAGATSTSAVVTAQWDEALNAEHYELQWRKDSGPWGAVQKHFGSVAELENAFSGEYEFKVVAVNKSKTSPPAFSEKLIVGDVPLQPTGDATQTLTPVAGVVTIDCSLYKNFKLTLAGNVTVALINVPQTKEIFIEILRTAAGNITWPSSVATAYTGPATVGSTDMVSLRTINFGSSWTLANNAVTSAGAFNVIINPNYLEFAADGSATPLNVTVNGAVGTPTFLWTRTDTNGGTNFTFSSTSVEDPSVSRVLAPNVPTQVQTWKVTATDSPNTAEATVTLVAVNEVYEDPDPMCLAADSFMWNGGRAYEVVPHEMVGVWDRNVDAPGVTAARAVSTILGRQPVYRLTTETGKSVRASSTTPMELRDGRTVLVPEMLNEDIVVCDRETGEGWWERVTIVEYLGVSTVAKIHAGDSMLLAGDDPRYMLATHNIRMKF